MQSNNRYWQEQATRAISTEEQRYCYQRIIEDDPDNYDARAALMRLGLGAMRAPTSATIEIVTLPMPAPNSTRWNDEAPQPTSWGAFIAGNLTGAALILAALALAQAAGLL